MPFIDAVRTKVDMREQVVSFPPQPVITSDNLVVSIDTVLYFKVVDPVRATYEIANFLQAIEQLTVTTLRNVIGSLDLERALTSREEINRHLSSVLDETTGRWGIKVTRVEIKAIEPPPSIRDSMEKQMRAERDRRAAILNAEGVKQSQILTAEGEKQSAVLRADGDRQARILQAEGQAKAIRTVFDAIHEANPSQKVLAYQYLQALPQIANGTANKVWIVPTELTKALEGMGGALGGLANMVGDLPSATVDAGAVEREAAEAAEAARGRGRAGQRPGTGRRGAGLRRQRDRTDACRRRTPVPPSRRAGQRRLQRRGASTTAPDPFANDRAAGAGRGRLGIVPRRLACPFGMLGSRIPTGAPWAARLDPQDRGGAMSISQHQTASGRPLRVAPAWVGAAAPRRRPTAPPAGTRGGLDLVGPPLRPGRALGPAGRRRCCSAGPPSASPPRPARCVVRLAAGWLCHVAMIALAGLLAGSRTRRSALTGLLIGLAGLILLLPLAALPAGVAPDGAPLTAEPGAHRVAGRPPPCSAPAGCCWAGRCSGPSWSTRPTACC